MKILRILPVIFFISVCFLNGDSDGLHFIKPRNNKALYDTQQTPPKTHEIRITGHHTNGKLDLEDASGNDAETVTVDSDDDIIWTNTDLDITIVNIKEKFLTGNHFKNKPSPQTPKKWYGKVDHYTGDKIHISKYFIRWKDSNGKERKYDPLIRINPRQLG